MKNIAFVESVTDESGTDHRVRACIDGVVLRGEWTSVEERTTKQAASIRAMLAAAPSIPDAEGQVRQGLSEAEIEEIVNYFNRRLLDTRKAWGWLDIARAIEAAHNIQPPKGEA